MPCVRMRVATAARSAGVSVVVVWVALACVVLDTVRVVPSSSQQVSARLGRSLFAEPLQVVHPYHAGNVYALRGQFPQSLRNVLMCLRNEGRAPV